MKLVLVLGDQLAPTLSALRAAKKERDVVVMAEVMAEATSVNHHRSRSRAPRHEELRDASAALDRPATEIVREALTVRLYGYRRRRCLDDVQAWAQRHAGTVYDLDTELEAAAAVHLLAAEPEAGA